MGGRTVCERYPNLVSVANRMNVHLWSDVRGYIFEILIHLVLVHEQLYSLGVDEDIASSILSQLVLQVALAFDFFISKIDR